MVKRALLLIGALLYPLVDACKVEYGGILKLKEVQQGCTNKIVITTFLSDGILTKAAILWHELEM